MKLKSFIAATGLALSLSVASMANADTANVLSFDYLGDKQWHSSSYSNSSNSFTDWFDFKLPSAAVPSAQGVSATISAGPQVTLTSMKLYNLTDNPLPSIAYDYITTFPSLMTSGSGSGGIWSLSFFMPSGTNSLSDWYRFVIKGNGIGTNGRGGYSLDTTVTAVPEPETYAMLLIGLGLLGFTARRRKSSSNLA